MWCLYQKLTPMQDLIILHWLLQNYVTRVIFRMLYTWVTAYFFWRHFPYLLRSTSWVLLREIPSLVAMVETRQKKGQFNQQTNICSPRDLHSTQPKSDNASLALEQDVVFFQFFIWVKHMGIQKPPHWCAKTKKFKQFQVRDQMYIHHSVVIDAQKSERKTLDFWV